MKNGEEITDQKEVNNKLIVFYNNSFKSDKRSSKYDIAQFLSSIQVSYLTEVKFYYLKMSLFAH